MKRGFTLVELLAVIVILGIIAMITIPNFNSIFKSASKKLSEEQISSIEGIARTWGVMNTNKLGECYILTLSELKSSGLLENISIIDPETSEELNDCVKISYDASNNQYDYTYTTTNQCKCS